MKNEIFRKYFLKIRTQRYTAEFKNDIIFHVGPLDEKLEVFKKYSGVPDERPPKQSVTPRFSLMQTCCPPVHNHVTPGYSVSGSSNERS